MTFHKSPPAAPARHHQIISNIYCTPGFGTAHAVAERQGARERETYIKREVDG